ncbi:MAG: anti-sigma factor [Candidatus Binatia bacterium]
MKCRHCLSLLSPYLDKKLTTHELREIQMHLTQCSACSEHLRQLTHNQQRIRALPPTEVSGRMELRLRERLQQRSSHSQPRRPHAWRQDWPLLSVGTVATCAASLIFYFAVLQSPPPVAAEEVVASMDQLLAALDPEDGHNIITADTPAEAPLAPWNDFEQGIFDDEDNQQ